MFVKFYLDESEKLKLEEIAKAKNKSLSKLCYDQILPLLSKPIINTDYLGDRTSESDNCTHYVKVYFSKGEYESLIREANGMPLSRFLRNAFISKMKPIELTIYTDDIASLALQVSEYSRKLSNFIAGLAIREQLYEADYQRLTQIASDTHKALQDVAKAVKANRKSIRASGVRILRKEIKKALQLQFDSGKAGEK